MFICVCHAITDHEVRRAVATGAHTLEGVAMALGVGTACGCCRESARELIEQAAPCGGSCAGCPREGPPN